MGILALVAALVIIIAGYGNKPQASICRTINRMNRGLGQPATCSSSPGAGTFVAAGIVAFVGLLLLAPWILRWLTGKKE